MNKIAVLYGFGPNGMKVITMIFECFEVGEQFMEEKMDLLDGKTGMYQRRNKETRQTERYEAPLVQAKEIVTNDGTRKIRYDLHHSVMEGENEEWMLNFFTSYYAGCGGIESFLLHEVPCGEKLVSFSLD